MFVAGSTALGLCGKAQPWLQDTHAVGPTSEAVESSVCISYSNNSVEQ